MIIAEKQHFKIGCAQHAGQRVGGGPTRRCFKYKGECASCSGKGTCLCVDCSGAGLIRCQTCNGKGTMTESNNCTHGKEPNSPHFYCSTHENSISQYHK